MTEPRTSFAVALHRLGALQFGSFTLKDGSLSPVYCDLRLLISDPETLRLAARHYATILDRLEYDRVAGIPYAGLPLATAISLETGKPMIFPRREVKQYGRQRAIEGRWKAGETIVVIDDLITSGKSKLEAIEPLEAAGLVVKDIVVLVDRRPSDRQDHSLEGYALHAAFTLEELAQRLGESGLMNEEEQAAIHQYLRN